MSAPLVYPLLAVIASRHLTATCTRLVHSFVENSLKQKKDHYETGASTACGFGPVTGELTPQPLNQPVDTNTLRLPKSFAFSNLDRFRVDSVYGVALTHDNVYEVIGEPIPGPSLVTIKIKRVTDGTS